MCSAPLAPTPGPGSVAQRSGPLLGDCKAGPKVSDSQEDSGSEEGLPETSVKCKCHGFPSDLKDVVLGWGVDAKMKHGLSGHLKTIL